MKMRMVFLTTVLVLAVLATPLFGEDKAPFDTAQAVPLMAPPPEMKQMEFMVGDWDVKGKMRMQPTDTNWLDFAATVSNKMVVGGAALQSDYKGPMMGQDFMGLALRSYDRETKRWQQLWVDSFGARLSIYTGGKEGDAWVFSGEDKYAGMTMHGRTVEYDFKPGGYKWRMETSMDGGKTWFTGMEATYTKK